MMSQIVLPKGDVMKGDTTSTVPFRQDESEITP